MRYALSAVAVASLATGTLAGVAAVHNHGNAHQYLHERAADYDLSGVDFNKISYSFTDGQCFGTYGCSPKKAAATGAPPAPAANAPAAPTGAPVNNAPVQKQAVQPPSYPPAPVNNAPANNAPANNAAANSAPNVASQVSSVAAPIASNLGGGNAGGSINIKDYNEKTTGDSQILPAVSSALCTEGTNLNNHMDISNDSGDDFVWTCWGSGASFVNTNAPLLQVPIPSGSKKTISFADTPGGSQGPGCAPVFLGQQMKFGQIKNTWLEATFNTWGTVDVSREVSITGHSISAQTAAGCTTDMDRCVFKCNDPNGAADTPGQCGKENSYKLHNCPDDGTANPAPMDGGCKIGTGPIKVSVGGLHSSY